MLSVSHLAGSTAGAGPAAVNDAGYEALIALLLLMSLPGIAGPLMMRRQLTTPSS